MRPDFAGPEAPRAVEMRAFYGFSRPAAADAPAPDAGAGVRCARVAR